MATVLRLKYTSNVDIIQLLLNYYYTTNKYVILYIQRIFSNEKKKLYENVQVPEIHRLVWQTAVVAL